MQGFAGGTLAQLSANVYQLNWSTGRSVTITDHGDYLDWVVGLGSQDGPGSVKGLLGSNSGWSTDFQLPDGTVLHQPNDAEILGVFADAWRVKPDSSLLDDTQGPNPALPSRRWRQTSCRTAPPRTIPARRIRTRTPRPICWRLLRCTPDRSIAGVARASA